MPSEKSRRMEPCTPAWWPACALGWPPVTSDVALAAANGLDCCVSDPKGRVRPLPAGVRGNVGAGLGGALAWPLSPPGRARSPGSTPEAGGSTAALHCAQGITGLFSPVGSSPRMLASRPCSGRLVLVCVCACASSEPRSTGCEGSWQLLAALAPWGMRMESSSSHDQVQLPNKPGSRPWCVRKLSSASAASFPPLGSRGGGENEAPRGFAQP